MTILQVLGFIVALVARLVLLFTGIPFLMSSLAFARSALDALATKFAHNGDLTSFSPDSSTKFNLYSVAFITVAFYLVAFAVYGIYVAIFSHKRGVKNLTLISSFTFTIAVLAFILATPSLETLSKHSLTTLEAYQALYDWDHHDKHVDDKHDGPAPKPDADPKRQATLAWDLVQESLHCCGFRQPEDWAPYKPDKFKNENVLPRTCCRDVFEAAIRGDGYCRANMERWTKNCSDEVHNAILQLVNVLGMTIYFGLLFSLLSSIILISHPYDVADNYYENYVDGFNVYHRGQHPNTINPTSNLISSNSYKHHYGAPMSDPYYYGSY